MSTVSLPATEEEFIPDLAYYRYYELDPDVWLNRRDRKDKARGYAASGVPLYLLVDRPRKQAVLHSEPHFVPDLKSSRYSRVVHVTYGEPLELPEPFNRMIDTSIFEH